MNWYKIATRPIRLPKEAYDQINNITEKISNFYLNNNKKPEQEIKLGNISFYNNFYGIEVDCDVYFNNEYATAYGGYISEDSKKIVLYPYEMGFSSGAKENKAFLNNIKYRHKLWLVHEVIHASDIKIRSEKIRNKHKGFRNKSYFEKPTEFDAYSRIIVDFIKDFISYGGIKIVKEFLKTGNIKIFVQKSKNIFPVPQGIANAIKSYKNNNALYKILLKRIYNEVINENTDK